MVKIADALTYIVFFSKACFVIFEPALFNFDDYDWLFFRLLNHSNTKQVLESMIKHSCYFLPKLSIDYMKVFFS